MLHSFWHWAFNAKKRLSLAIIFPVKSFAPEGMQRLLYGKEMKSANKYIIFIIYET